MNSPSNHHQATINPSYPYFVLSPFRSDGDRGHRAPRVEGAAWNPLRELKERETAYIFEASIMADIFLYIY